MPDTFSANYNFTLPEVNGSRDTWGEKLVQNWSAIDGILNTLNTGKLSLAGGTVTGVVNFTMAPTISGAAIATQTYVGTQITAAVNTLNGVDAALDARLDALEAFGLDPRVDALEAQLAGAGVVDTRLDALESAQAFTPGMIMDYAGATAPSKWLLCFGQAISRTTYADLFAAIGTTYGVGDGTTTFNVPDLRGRVSAGQDDMGGTSANRLTNPASTIGGIDGDVLGATGGEEAHVQTVAQLAAHTHNYQKPNNSASTTGGGDGYWQDQTGTFTTTSTGSGAAFNVVQPTIILNKIIYTGVA